MFENLKNLSGMAGLMKDLPRIREKMDEVRERLKTITVQAETGGGAVAVTSNAALQITSVRVDPALMSTLVDPSNPDDKAIAEELLVGAINAALTKARERAAEEFADAAQELGIPIPPGGLPGLT